MWKNGIRCAGSNVRMRGNRAWEPVRLTIAERCRWGAAAVGVSLVGQAPVQAGAMIRVSLAVVKQASDRDSTSGREQQVGKFSDPAYKAAHRRPLGQTWLPCIACDAPASGDRHSDDRTGNVRGCG